MHTQRIEKGINKICIYALPLNFLSETVSEDIEESTGSCTRTCMCRSMANKQVETASQADMLVVHNVLILARLVGSSSAK